MGFLLVRLQRVSRMKRVAATVMVFLAVGASAALAGLEGDVQKVLDEKYMRGKDYGIEVLRLGTSPGEAKVWLVGVGVNWACPRSAHGAPPVGDVLVVPSP